MPLMRGEPSRAISAAIQPPTELPMTVTSSSPRWSSKLAGFRASQALNADTASAGWSSNSGSTYLPMSSMVFRTRSCGMQ